MPVADRDEGSQRPAPVRRRPPTGPGGDDRPAGPPRRPAPPAQQPIRRPPPAPTGDGTPPGPGSRLDDLYRLAMPKLFALAEREGIADHTGMSRAQLIVGIVRRQIERGEVVRGSGTLEVLPDGYGFLRSQAHNYLASPEDIYVSPSQIRRMGLKTGLVVEGPIRLPIEGQDNFALMQVELVNGASPEETASVTNFEDLTPLHPNARFVLETTGDELMGRVVDIVTPIGKGQRGL